MRGIHTVHFEGFRLPVIDLWTSHCTWIVWMPQIIIINQPEMELWYDDVVHQPSSRNDGTQIFRPNFRVRLKLEIFLSSWNRIFNSNSAWPAPNFPAWPENLIQVELELISSWTWMDIYLFEVEFHFPPTSLDAGTSGVQSKRTWWRRQLFPRYILYASPSR